MTDLLYELSGVGVTYGSAKRRVEVLSGLDFDMRRGELCVVRGPSGSGKTTLLFVLGGLLRPQTGDVLRAGRPVYEGGAIDEGRRRIGFVFQGRSLLPYRPVIDNVAMALWSGTRAERRERAKRMLGAVGLADRVLHLPPQLSAGERQRVAIARALVGEPDVILADEPTGNLDRGNAEKVMEALLGFRATGGSIVLVTHDERLEPGESRELRLSNGRLAVRG